MKLLGVEPQCGSDVTRARAFRDQTAHGMVELGPSPSCVLFEMFQPLLSLPGLGQQLLIHIPHSKGSPGFLGHGHFCAPYAEKCP